MTDNSQYLAVWGARDHEFPTTTGTANVGTHAQVTFNNLAGTPGFAGASSVLFAKSVSGQSQLFFDNNGTPTQLTSSAVLNAASGYTYLAGGLLIQWGFQVANDGGTISFPIIFTGSVWSVMVNANNTGAVIVNAISANASGFTLSAVNGSGGSLTNVSTYFLAIGST
jgi:hypothetical protein